MHTTHEKKILSTLHRLPCLLHRTNHHPVKRVQSASEEEEAEEEENNNDTCLPAAVNDEARVLYFGVCRVRCDVRARKRMGTDWTTRRRGDSLALTVQSAVLLAMIVVMRGGCTVPQLAVGYVAFAGACAALLGGFAPAWALAGGGRRRLSMHTTTTTTRTVQ